MLRARRQNAPIMTSPLLTTVRRRCCAAQTRRAVPRHRLVWGRKRRVVHAAESSHCCGAQAEPQGLAMQALFGCGTNEPAQPLVMDRHSATKAAPLLMTSVTPRNRPKKTEKPGIIRHCDGFEPRRADSQKTTRVRWPAWPRRRKEGQWPRTSHRDAHCGASGRHFAGGSICRSVRGNGGGFARERSAPRHHVIAGTPIPDWRHLADLAAAAPVFAGIRTQSWEVAFIGDGPVFFELNYDGDFNLAQLASGNRALDGRYVAHPRECGYRI